MKENYYIRNLKPEDANAILHLAMSSWKYTYKEIFTIDFIESYVTRAYRTEVIERITHHNNYKLTKFYVLLEKSTEKILGFAQIGYDRYWEIQVKNPPLRLFRIYLDPVLIGKGFGKLLLRRVEEFVKAEQFDNYIVGVHEKNTIGLRFYKKNGFLPISKTPDAEGEIYFEKKIQKEE